MDGFDILPLDTQILMRPRLMTAWLLLACLAAALAPPSPVRAAGAVTGVEASLANGKTQLMVSLSQPLAYTVIRLGRREVLVAVQDASLKAQFKAPSPPAGGILEKIAVSQKNMRVVSILAALKQEPASIAHRAEQGGKSLVVEFETEKAPASPPRAAAAEKPSPKRAVRPQSVRSKPPAQVSDKETIPEPTAQESVPSEAPPGPSITPEFLAHFALADPHDLAGGAEAKDWDARLAKPGPDTGMKDYPLLVQAADFFAKGQWQQAMEKAEELQRLFPASGVGEQAAFLAARAFHKLKGGDLERNVATISQKYRDAIKQHPMSTHAPEALAQLASVYMEVGNYPEAAAYCDLVWEHHKERAMTPDFMLIRGKALLGNGQTADAVRIFDMLIGYFPEAKQVEAARLEKAKVLYEERAYKQSLEALDAIAAANPGATLQYPDFLLYQGENHYQLRNLPQARQAFYSALNLFPKVESADTIMTKIGDTYKEQDEDDKAALIYRLVVNSYPGTDGRLVSLMRLADYMEKYPDKEVFEGMTSADIHKEMVRNNPDHPLAQVSMLKLARLAHKNKQYEESVSILLGLLTRHPFTKLQDDVREAILASVEAIFLRDHKAGNYKGIIEYYDKVRDVVPFEDMPQLLFIVANAYRHNGMCSWALTLLKRVAAFYEDPKPAEVIFTMAECHQILGDLAQARMLMETFVMQYPQNPNILQAHYHLAAIYLREDNPDAAAHSLEICTAPGSPYAGDFDLLSRLAEAQKKIGNHAASMKTLEKAAAVALGLDPPRKDLAGDILEQIGDLQVLMKNYPLALTHFQKALDLLGDAGPNPALEFKMARVLGLSGDGEKAAQLLENLAKSGSGVWADAARALLEQVRVKGIWDETG